MGKEPLVQRGFRITGRVQGVFFRAWTQKTAQEMGIEGTVRNLPDGSVEAHASGPIAVMSAFEARLWEGPPASRVVGVAVSDSDAELPSGSFQVLY